MRKEENCMWARSQFDGVSLGDKRLNSRVKLIASNMMADPSASIPQQNKVWKDTKGAYRFFDSKRVVFDDVIRPHVELTKKKIEKRELILAIQDTCFITYSHHQSVKGLSKFSGEVNKAAGIVLHNTLAVDPTRPHPEVIGVLDQHIHNRNKVSDKDDNWKESKLWGGS